MCQLSFHSRSTQADLPPFDNFIDALKTRRICETTDGDTIAKFNDQKCQKLSKNFILFIISNQAINAVQHLVNSNDEADEKIQNVLFAKCQCVVFFIAFGYNCSRRLREHMEQLLRTALLQHARTTPPQTSQRYNVL